MAPHSGDSPQSVAVEDTHVKLNCQHRSCAIGETFTRCIVCLSWRFTLGGRWWPEAYELPWLATDREDAGDVYQISGIRLTQYELGT